ncbi:hypothetical protein [Kribbella qitaiheensis]|nr:hypothetical protein [Kribbella qitaiheensis]
MFHYRYSGIEAHPSHPWKSLVLDDWPGSPDASTWTAADGSGY